MARPPTASNVIGRLLGAGAASAGRPSSSDAARAARGAQILGGHALDMASRLFGDRPPEEQAALGKDPPRLADSIREMLQSLDPTDVTMGPAISFWRRQLEAAQRLGGQLSAGFAGAATSPPPPPPPPSGQISPQEREANQRAWSADAAARRRKAADDARAARVKARQDAEWLRGKKPAPPPKTYGPDRPSTLFPPPPPAKPGLIGPLSLILPALMGNVMPAKVVGHYVPVVPRKEDHPRIEGRPEGPHGPHKKVTAATGYYHWPIPTQEQALKAADNRARRIDERQRALIDARAKAGDAAAAAAKKKAGMDFTATGLKPGRTARLMERFAPGSTTKFNAAALERGNCVPEDTDVAPDQDDVQLCRNAMAKAQAHIERFPAGIPPSNDRSRELAKDFQRQGLRPPGGPYGSGNYRPAGMG